MVNDPESKELVMVSLPENRQEERIYDLIESNKGKNRKICYLLLRTSFNYMCDELKKRNLLSNMQVIDLLSHNSGTGAKDNITSLTSPSVSEILNAVELKIKKDKCNLLIIDTISQLLHYQPRYEIQRLTNCMKTQENYKGIKKIFLFSASDELVQEEREELFSDLSLFADKIISQE